MMDNYYVDVDFNCPYYYMHNALHMICTVCTWARHYWVDYSE